MYVCLVCGFKSVLDVTCGDANVHMLYLSRHDHCKELRGWYVTRSLKAEDLWVDDNIVAWARSRNGEPHTWPKDFYMKTYVGYKGYVNYEREAAPIIMQAYVPWLEQALNDAINGFTYRAMGSWKSQTC